MPHRSHNKVDKQVSTQKWPLGGARQLRKAEVSGSSTALFSTEQIINQVMIYCLAPKKIISVIYDETTRTESCFRCKHVFYVLFHRRLCDYLMRRRQKAALVHMKTD